VNSLEQLAELIRQKNAIDVKIAAVIGRPALMGHVGEYIAKCVFDLELNNSASSKATDGDFRSGPLAGKSVNVKWVGKQEGLLDLGSGDHPDYYLVLAGPSAPPTGSRGGTRPWAIAAVYLFDTEHLIPQLTIRGVRAEASTMKHSALWEVAVRVGASALHSACAARRAC
jgi:hypothetical protein